MTDFLKNVRASIYDPAYYASLKGRSLGYSMKYFVLLAAWLAVIASAVLLFSIIPNVNSFLANAGAKAIEYYPAGLQITVASGSVSANVPQPYFLPLPGELAENLSPSSYMTNATGAPQNLLVIDTADPLTADEFKNDSTVILLASDSVAYVKQGSIVIQPLGSDVSFTVDKAGVASLVQKIEPYLRLIDWLIGVFLPIGVFVGIMFRLLYLFILALLIWALVRIQKMKISYGQAYRFGIHLMTFPLLVTAVFWLVIPSASIPFLFTLLTLIMTVANIRSTSLQPPAEQSSSSSSS